MSVAVRHTWFMVGRQLRNLMREPIWIALLLVQPMVWLLLYGQLFKRVTHLPGGGFGTTSYITFPRAGDRDHERLLRSDLERHGDDQRPRPRRAAALPRNARQPDLARGLPDRPLGADRGHPGAIILLVSIALGVRVHTAVLGW